MTSRWWLLTLLSTVILISSLHLWRHRNKPLPGPVAEPEPEDSVAVQPAPRLVREPRSARPTVRKPKATSMATVRGRVLGAQGDNEEGEKEITLVVSDKKHEFEVAVGPDGSFVIELAPGTYRFHAEHREMKATLDAVTISAEDNRAVLLQLTAGVSIRGTLRPPSDEKKDVGAQFEFRLSGEIPWSESEGATVENNEFTVSGLEAGKRYDLRVTADGFRPVELTGLPAPSEGHVLDLVRLARLRGGFGIARGETCPIREVTITVDDAQTETVRMDAFCRFQSGPLPPTQRVRVQVSEENWPYDLLVDVPPQGDPPFLCLHALCREPASDEVSTLEISLADSPDRGFFAAIAYDHSGASAHAPTGQIARVSDLPSGTTARVSVYARSCRTMEQTLVLQPGVNRLNLTCDKR